MTTHKNTQKHRQGSHAAKQQPVSDKRQSPRATGSSAKQWAIVAGLAVAAFFGAYMISRSVNGTPAATSVASATGAVTAAAPIAATTSPTNRTGSADQSEGTAAVENGVQKIAVKVGFDYSPRVIRLKAGVPAEITFGQAQGCTGFVQSQQLGFQEDLSTGAKTVKLDGLQPGTYGFACGMNMVRGQIIVS